MIFRLVNLLYFNFIVYILRNDMIAHSGVDYDTTNHYISRVILHHNRLSIVIRIHYISHIFLFCQNTIIRCLSSADSIRYDILFVIYIFTHLRMYIYIYTCDVDVVLFRRTHLSDNIPEIIDFSDDLIRWYDCPNTWLIKLMHSSYRYSHQASRRLSLFINSSNELDISYPNPYLRTLKSCVMHIFSNTSREFDVYINKSYESNIICCFG